MTAYLNSFTGNTIASSNATLNTITFTATQPTVNLVWNLNGYDTSINAGNYAATYLIVNGSLATTPLLVLPSAQQVSPGEEITIVNTGTNAIQVKYFALAQGSSLVTIASQQSVKIVLQSNTTAQGVWQVVTTSLASGLSSINQLNGRGLATRATPTGPVANVFDTVWPRVVTGGDQTLTADQSSQVLVFDSAGTITLSSTPVPPFGTYFIIKNVSNGRLTVTGAVMDGITNGNTFVNPGAFGTFVYGGYRNADGTIGGAGSWFSMIGTTSVGTSINTSSGLNYNATIVDCMNGAGAMGVIYTMQNQDFGTVISYENVQQNQQVILPLRVALYVVRNTGLGVNQNITFKGVAGTTNLNTVTLAGSQYSVLATDGIGNVYPGISSLPGNQVVNVFPGSVNTTTGAVVNGLFFDNDAGTGLFSNSQDNLFGISVASTIAGTISGNATTTNMQFGGSFSVPNLPGPNVNVNGVTTVNMTLNGSLTVRDNVNALGGLDGGVI